MIQQSRPWEGKLAEVEEQRARRKPPKLNIIVSNPGLKGRPPQRQCPADFDVIFVEIGRLDCEHWYRARRTTIDRWLAERGKDRLIKARAEYVRFLRSQGKKPRGTPSIQVRPAQHRKPADDGRSGDDRFREHFASERRQQLAYEERQRAAAGGG